MGVFFVNASTALNATELNKVMMGDTYTGGNYMTLCYEIAYDGANWGVTATAGTKQSAAAVAPVWNAGDNRLDITLTLSRAFTGTPCVFTSSKAGTSHASGLRYGTQAHATSTTAIIVRFIDLASTGAYVTTQSTKMAFNIKIEGYIG